MIIAVLAFTHAEREPLVTSWKVKNRDLETELQADLFSVKVLKKFASFELLEEARLNDIGGL